MLTVVVVGGGSIGGHVATLLSREHNVILIDSDRRVLERLGQDADMATRYGSGSDWQLLEELLELSPDILIALTQFDEVNLVTCTLAKHLGYPHVIARVRHLHYISQSRLNCAKIFDIDDFFSPELLTAQEIIKYVDTPSLIRLESFAHGAVELRSFLLRDWKRDKIPLARLNMPKEVIIGLIYRPEQDLVIFPHGDDFLLNGDEVTLICESRLTGEVNDFFDLQESPIASVAIAGGSLIAIHLAYLLLERNIRVQILDSDPETCAFLAEQLPDCSVKQCAPNDASFLLEEGVHEVDLFVAAEGQDESDILNALMAKEVGCKRVITLLNDTRYEGVLLSSSIQRLFSPRLVASNYILNRTFSATISSLVSFYDNRMEIIEIKVSKNSPLVGIPLAQLGPFLPSDLLIAMIQSCGRIMIAHGNHIISPGDTVIVITHPRHASELEKIF